MSKYVSCIHLTMRQLQITSKRLSTLGTANLSPRHSQTLSNTCLCCQISFSSFSTPTNKKPSKDKQEKTIEECDKSNHQSFDTKSEMRSNAKKQSQKLVKNFTSFEFSETKKNFRDPSKYFEQKFLKHKNSVSDADQNHEDKESDLSNKISKQRKQPTADFFPDDKFGTFAQTKIGKTETDMRNPNERIDEALPEDIDEPRDRRLDIPLTREGRIGKTSFYYNRKIARYGREGKIKEAIEVYEEIMMLRDRVKPSKRTFVTLIGILGRVGYTKKAFELYTKMKHLGLDPEDHIYTSLFNACANSPFPAEALRKAQDLLWSLQDRGIRPNIFTVKAAMKAFSLCGDFPMAFRLMDKASTWLKLDTECFNHLLMASISDKSKGFHRALQVWQKMREYRVAPNTSSYSLLIRCVRDCGIGDPKEFAEYLGLDSSKADLGEDFHFLGNATEMKNHKMPEKNQLLVIGKSIKNKNIESKTKGELKSASRIDHQFQNVQSGNDRLKLKDVEKCDQDILILPVTNQMEVVHSRNPDLTKSLYLDILTDRNSVSTLQLTHSDKISISKLQYPEGRLAALGGSSTILKHMAATGAQPSIQTYTLILACIPNNELSEFELLAHMENNNAVPDVDFLNDIMMRRNKRKERETVKSLLPVMSRLRLTPNMRTFAALAMACQAEKDAQDLLNDMKGANLEPTSEVMGHLIFSSRMNYNYKMSMLIKLESLGLKPARETIALIESTIAKTKKLVVEAEKNKDENSFYLSQQFQTSFQKFLRFYRHWLQRTELEKEKHPWKAYELTKDNGEDVKKTPV